MTLGAFLRLLRRWLFAIVIGVAVAIAAAFAAFSATPASYEVTARFLFLSAAIDAEGEPVNPFLQLGNGIGVLIDVVSTSMRDGTTVRAITDDREGLDYTVSADAGIAAPVMRITVTDTSPESAFDVLDELGSESLSRARTIQLQAGAPAVALIEGTALTRSAKADVDQLDAIRNGVLAGVGVLALTLVAIVIADRRRSRRAAETMPDDLPMPEERKPAYTQPSAWADE